MKILRISKALLKPRPLIGILSTLIAIWAGYLNDVSLWWSIPAGFWWADTLGFIYEETKKEMQAQ